MSPAAGLSPEAIAASTVAAELARQRGEDLWLVFVMPSNTVQALGNQVLSAADEHADLRVVAQGAFEASDCPVLLGRPSEPR